MTMGLPAAPSFVVVNWPLYVPSLRTICRPGCAFASAALSPAPSFTITVLDAAGIESAPPGREDALQGYGVFPLHGVPAAAPTPPSVSSEPSSTLLSCGSATHPTIAKAARTQSPRIR